MAGEADLQRAHRISLDTRKKVARQAAKGKAEDEALQANPLEAYQDWSWSLVPAERMLRTLYRDLMREKQARHEYHQHHPHHGTHYGHQPQHVEHHQHHGADHPVAIELRNGWSAWLIGPGSSYNSELANDKHNKGRPMKSNLMSSLVIALLLSATACSTQPATAPTVESYMWHIDSLDEISGHSVQVDGDPQMISTALGNAIAFDGDGDRLLVDHNPLDGATEFTIEVVFKPNDAFPDNQAPRFFHIESADMPNRRITVELRLNDQNQWYLDAYIKSEKSAYTLIDETLVHPVGEWAHAAITYRDRQFTSFVNGEKELTAKVDYLPIPSNAKTSVGARMNKVHWFNGAIRAARITHRVLEPEEFIKMENLH